MNKLADLFDSYSRRARLYPALLLSMPASVSMVLLWPGLGLQKLAPIVVAAGLPFLAVSLIRTAGKRLESRLIERWDGLPTTRALRLTEGSNGTELRRRRRDRLVTITGHKLPTAAEETSDPHGSDQRLVAAVRALITKVREDKTCFPRLHEENAEYGFRRNLLAAKPVALSVLAVLLGADGLAVHLGRNAQLVGTTSAIHLILIVVWLCAVRRRWVRDQADTYAERLFETMDHPRFEAAARSTG